MIVVLESVVLAEDLPEHGLKRGDIGTVALIHRGGAGYESGFILFLEEGAQDQRRH